MVDGKNKRCVSLVIMYLSFSKLCMLCASCELAFLFPAGFCVCCFTIVIGMLLHCLHFSLLLNMFMSSFIFFLLTY